MKKLIIALIVLILILIVGMGIFVYSVSFPAKSASGDSVIYDDAIAYNTGSPFVTTLRDSKKIIKADIVIEIHDKKEEKILSDFNYRVRDCILNILGDISEDDIDNKEFKENLKIEIKDALQEMLKLVNIKGIYFNEFVIQ